MSILAVIPARGGSKSIPQKNFKLLGGKPLITWSIESAKRSKYPLRIVVSTDDHDIRRIAIKSGAEAPFIRPAELSTDSIGIEPVLKHTFEYYRDTIGYKAKMIALLMPTSPLRQHFHIDEAIDLFLKTKADSVVSVNEIPANHTPYWTLIKNKLGRVKLWGGIDLRNILTRRQDFPQKCYARNDLVYILNPKNLYERKINLYGKKVELYEIINPSLYEIDINTPDEWDEANRRIKLLRRKWNIR